MLIGGSRNGKDLLVSQNGFSYAVNKRNSTSTYWNCSKRSCSAKVTERNQNFEASRTHNHPAVHNLLTHKKTIKAVSTTHKILRWYGGIWYPNLYFCSYAGGIVFCHNKILLTNKLKVFSKWNLFPDTLRYFATWFTEICLWYRENNCIIIYDSWNLVTKLPILSSRCNCSFRNISTISGKRECQTSQISEWEQYSWWCDDWTIQRWCGSIWF